VLAELFTAGAARPARDNRLRSRLDRRISHDFPCELLASVAPPAGDEKRPLDQLVAARLMLRRGSPPAADCRFKHALCRRQLIARGLAPASCRLAARFPDIANAQSQLLAQDFTEAGLTGRSPIGERDSSSAQGALDRLPTHPHPEERDRKELDLLVALGFALGGAKGYGGDELHQANAHA
jgi:hypothetical protein